VKEIHDRAEALRVYCRKHDAQSRVGELAISIRGLRENDRWSMLADLDGEPFLSWEDFCQYPEPYGLGLSAEQVEAILDRSNAGKRLSAVLGEHGRLSRTFGASEAVREPRCR
jgi:hypothetical protein